MRIVAGRHRRRRLVAPEGTGVRPTADRVRETLFNILVAGNAWRGLDGARVADIFCGTGAIALEALSRGASHAVLVDNAPAALDAASRNVVALGEDRRTMLGALRRNGAIAGHPSPCRSRLSRSALAFGPGRCGTGEPAVERLAQPPAPWLSSSSRRPRPFASRTVSRKSTRGPWAGPAWFFCALPTCRRPGQCTVPRSFPSPPPVRIP